MELTVEQKARIERGARLLDVEHPGWYDDINLADLDIDSFRRCILGKLYGSYFDAVHILFRGNLDNVDKLAAECGFYPHPSEDPSFVDTLEEREQREALSKAKADYWSKVVRFRRESV